MMRGDNRGAVERGAAPGRFLGLVGLRGKGRGHRFADKLLDVASPCGDVVIPIDNRGDPAGGQLLLQKKIRQRRRIKNSIEKIFHLAVFENGYVHDDAGSAGYGTWRNVGNNSLLRPASLLNGFGITRGGQERAERAAEVDQLLTGCIDQCQVLPGAAIAGERAFHITVEFREFSFIEMRRCRENLQALNGNQELPIQRR